MIDLAVMAVMPSIRTALGDIAGHADSRRLTLIRCPQGSADTIRYWLEQALRGLPNAKLRSAVVSGDQNVAMIIAGAAQVDSISPQSQAMDRCSGQQIHLLLNTVDAASRHLVEYYCVQFMQYIAVGQVEGLRIYLVDDRLQYAETNKGAIGVVSLSDLLTPEEMSAYVALRMTSRPGPGMTHLARALVERFSGSDPRMAEILMDLSDAELIALPGSFPLRLLPPPPNEARQQLLSADDPQILFRQRLPGNPELERAATRKLLKLRSHAFVQALMPWMEEHRAVMCAKLEPVLAAHRAKSGELERYTGGQKKHSVAMDLVEFNDIANWEYRENLGIAKHWPQFLPELDACYAARQIRNSIAHTDKSGMDARRVLSAVALIEMAFPVAS